MKQNKSEKCRKIYTYYLHNIQWLLLEKGIYAQHRNEYMKYLRRKGNVIISIHR